MNKWKTLSSKLAFDHRWFKVRQDTVELPNGKILDDYFMWEGNNISLVVPVTANNEFILVKQYKHATDEIMIEFPAGMIDKNESPEQTAVRELREETGYESSSVTLLTKVTDHPTKARYSVYIYLAKNVVLRHKTEFDENEEIEVLVKTHSDVMDMIMNHEIWVSGSIVGALMAMRKLGLS